jgi:hypothetical protein
MNEKLQWIRAGGVTIDCADVLVDLKTGTPVASEFLHNLVLRKIAAAMAAANGLEVSEAEMQNALSAFYTGRNLFEPEQIAAWLRSVPIDERTLRGFLRERILSQRLGRHIVTEAAVHDRFGANPHDFAHAEVNVFTFTTEGAAREFILAVGEGEITPFAEHRRIVRREAPAEIAAALFAAQAGSLVGPLETDDRRYQVYRLLHHEEAILDDRLKEQLRAEILAEVLKAELIREPQSFLL